MVSISFWFAAALFANSAFAKDSEPSCTFPGHQEQVIIQDCLGRNADHSFKILKSALKRIKFDEQGLAGGTILNNGCYWLNQKGVLRKTFCFDNGADYFQEGLARYIDKDGKFGYMNTKLSITIPAKYSFALPFAEGYAKACIDCKISEGKDPEHRAIGAGEWVILDKAGKIITQCTEPGSSTDCHPPAEE